MALSVIESTGLIRPEEVAGVFAAILPLRAFSVAELIKSAAASIGMRQAQFRSHGRAGQYLGEKRIVLSHLRVQGESRLLARWRGIDDETTL